MSKILCNVLCSECVLVLLIFMKNVESFLRQFMLLGVEGRGEVYFHSVILRKSHQRQCNNNWRYNVLS